MQKPIDHQITTAQVTTGRKRQNTVIIFGEVLFDRFPDGAVLGGAPFNVARHLQAFGMHPVLISRTGNDALRERIIDSMHSWGMETVGVQSDPLHPTGQVAVHLHDGRHEFEILDEQAYDFIHPSIARMVELSMHPRLIYFGTLAQRHALSRRAVTTLLREASTPRLLDLNLRAPWYDTRIITRSIESADIVKMSDDELAILVKTLRLHGGEPTMQATELIKRFKLDRILVTCGKAGAWLLDKNGMLAKEVNSSKPGTVIDTVGAGDAFAAVFIGGMLLGWPTYLTMSRANTFAAAICGIRGAIPDKPDFYDPFLRDWGLG